MADGITQPVILLDQTTGLPANPINVTICIANSGVVDLSSESGSVLVGFDQGVDGSIPSTVQDVLRESTVSVKRFGVVGSGIADDTTKLIVAFSSGGKIYVPEGNYLISGAGVDAGGVYVTITKSTHIVCHPNARFFTNNLDNDFIRFTVPSDGTGLPSDGITFEWEGGFFDQRNQKVSTVTPVSDIYPAPTAMQGASATCDGLSIRGDYIVDGTEYSGIKKAVVKGVTFVAGTHWQSGGGDSGLFVSGCEEQHVSDCRMIGFRDSGIYASGSTNGTLRCRAVVENCEAVNCVHGIDIKRAAKFSKIINNHAENCVRGFLFDLVSGTEFEGSEIAGNSGNHCGIFFRIKNSVRFSLHDNHTTNLGALLADGTSVEPLGGCAAIGLYGCSYATVSNNTCKGETTGLSSAYASRPFILCDTEGTTITTFCTFFRNIGYGLRDCGQDNGQNNSFIENVVYSATVSGNMTVLGTNAYEVRVNPSNGVRTYRNQFLLGDGTKSAPSLSRENQTDTGLYFLTNTVGMSVGGEDRIKVNNTGLGFFGETPIAKPTITGSKGGNAALTSLLSSLASYGVITDSTT